MVKCMTTPPPPPKTHTNLNVSVCFIFVFFHIYISSIITKAFLLLVGANRGVCGGGEGGGVIFKR